MPRVERLQRHHHPHGRPKAPLDVHNRRRLNGHLGIRRFRLQDLSIGYLIPRAAVRPRPLQHLQVPALSGTRARRRVPNAAVIPRPLQDLYTPARSGDCTRPLDPRAVVRPGPSQPLD